ncbi:chloride channel protein [Cavenderia fasciculata]|uniref:Chloride channel protein n=1 Tax=Cavenderia fasciculata TaxID=261658 RepID=F4PSA9_CACFS|nr:chloride channel protein [Cavenderia fasciculata]EGG20655.1 chloride channel protein [Cavenderia fasciculata]|eukprot:XP_004358505.1 chloride channel protein [Cavenderia fasciculata]
MNLDAEAILASQGVVGQDSPPLRSVSKRGQSSSTYAKSEVDLFQKQAHTEGKTLCGLILRSQLLVLLKRRIFVDFTSTQESLNFTSYEGAERLPLDYAEFCKEMASRLPTVHEISQRLTPQDMERFVDLRPYMNFAVVSIKNYSSLSEAYRLFRLAGLRHLVVVNVFNQIVGMITRKDLL